MTRGDLPPQGGCPMHGPQGCPSDCPYQRQVTRETRAPQESREGTNSAEASWKKLGELTDVHMEIVELLRGKFAPGGVRKNPLGKGEFTVQNPRGRDSQVIYSDDNPHTEGGSIFRIAAVNPERKIGYTTTTYRGQPESGRSYTGRIEVLHNGITVTDIGLEFSYGTVQNRSEDLPLRKATPKLKLIDSARLVGVGIQDSGIYLTSRELLQWEDDFGALMDRVLSHELVQKNRMDSTDPWDQEVVQSVADLRRIWDEALAKKLFGKLQLKVFEEQFPEARSLGEKPPPRVMSHQTFQAGIQNIRGWMEYFREGIRNHVGGEMRTSPASAQSVARSTEKISLAKQVRRSPEPSGVLPPEHSSILPKAKISLAKKKPPKR